MIFIDYAKASDSIKHSSVISAMRKQGVESKYIRIVIEMYKNLKARVKTDKVGTSFSIKRGVKQGDPLSSLLFNCVLEDIFRDMDWNKKGINMNGEYLNNLRYADDVVLFSDSRQEIEEMVCELEEKSKLRGMSMNIDKTAVMSSNKEDIQITIDEKKIERVEEIVYLGQNISMRNRTAEEVERRIALTWAKFWSLKNVFKGRITVYNKTKILNSCVLPTLKYGSQTWSLSKNDESKIKVTQNSMERSMMGIRLKDRLSMNTVRKKIKNRVNFLHEIKRQKWNCAGHI